MTKTKFEYCVIVGAQHNYTDDEGVAIDWYNAEVLAWLDNGRPGPEPELLKREIGSTSWREA